MSLKRLPEVLLPHAVGTTMEFITVPDRMAYHDQTNLRRWQDKD